LRRWEYVNREVVNGGDVNCEDGNRKLEIAKPSSGYEQMFIK
jgi:hypothetical protein